MENRMKKQSSIGFLLIALATASILSALFAVPGCSSGSGTSTSSTSTSGVSFSADIQPIFNNYCVVCHQGVGYAGLTLEPNISYGKLVGVASTEDPGELRVKSGAPNQSYLIAKLNGTQVAAGGSGAQMPYNQPPLSSEQISLIEQWISEGAPNN
jgi:hypothetical protein